MAIMKKKKFRLYDDFSFCCATDNTSCKPSSYFLSYFSFTCIIEVSKDTELPKQLKSKTEKLKHKQVSSSKVCKQQPQNSHVNLTAFPIFFVLAEGSSKTTLFKQAAYIAVVHDSKLNSRSKF